VARDLLAVLGAVLEGEDLALRAAEGLYGWVLDHPEVSLAEVALALQALADRPDLCEAARCAARLLAESGSVEGKVRDRVRSRRTSNHGSPLDLARRGDAEALRRLPGRAFAWVFSQPGPPRPGP